MNEKFQQAISAARNGHSKEAQLILTQILKADQSDTQAWFLLGALVEPSPRKAAFLGKVLALDPEHEKAKRMLAHLVAPKKESEVGAAETAVSSEPSPPPEVTAVAGPPPISSGSTGHLVEEKADTIPDWLVEEAAVWDQPVSRQTVEETAVDSPMPEVPDWLQDEVSETWSEEPPEDRPIPIAAQPTKPYSAPIAKTSEAALNAPQAEQRASLTRILYILITVAVIILVVMVYLIWRAL